MPLKKVFIVYLLSTIIRKIIIIIGIAENIAVYLLIPTKSRERYGGGFMGGGEFRVRNSLLFLESWAAAKIALC